MTANPLMLIPPIPMKWTDAGGGGKSRVGVPESLVITIELPEVMVAS
jgi:hypothetical protein